MPFQSSPLLQGARPAASWRAYHDVARALEAVEPLALRLVNVPASRLWVAIHRSEPPQELAPAIAEVVARNGPLVVGDRDAGAGAPIERMMHHLCWRALLAVPLHDASGGVFGVLLVADARRRAWTEQEVLLLRDLAMLAALAHPRGRGDVRLWLQHMALEAAREARRNLEAEHARAAAAEAERAAVSATGWQRRRHRRW